MESLTGTKEAHNGLSVLLLAFRWPSLRWSRRLWLTIRIGMLLPCRSAQDSTWHWMRYARSLYNGERKGAGQESLFTVFSNTTVKCVQSLSKLSFSVISQVSKMFWRYIWITRISRTKNSVKSCYPGLITTKSYDSMMQTDLGHAIWSRTVLFFLKFPLNLLVLTKPSYYLVKADSV